ncbi:MAG: cell wall metabolism sensor histidine kinase WalK, partial [Firmicutes bacterium]|nr:cell wall metabolism sensor histidine kinase WalK [Bacillota bacterium]
MNRSLYTRLVLIIFVLILTLTAVMGAFLMRRIQGFYIDDFYTKMSQAFSSANAQMVTDLRNAAAQPSEDEAVTEMIATLRSNAGLLGIATGARSYFILDGETGALLQGSDTAVTELPATANILMAMMGKTGDVSDSRAAYMDVAIPIPGGDRSYIVYIRDNKATVTKLSGDIFSIILEAMLIGLVISVALSLLLARAMVTPIQNLTCAARRVAGGDFSDPLESKAKDEIGVLTQTFNDMAGQLEST